MTPEEFIRESNAIENIKRAPLHKEIEEYERFMELREITVEDMIRFVSVYQPGAKLRNKKGLNVRVGTHFPPPGHPHMEQLLAQLLARASNYFSPEFAFQIHCEYETLHPFTDGNGRSGRMLWMWMMKRAPLGFLHTWYYQSLQATR